MQARADARSARDAQAPLFNAGREVSDNRQDVLTEEQKGWEITGAPGTSSYGVAPETGNGIKLNLTGVALERVPTLEELGITRAPERLNSDREVAALNAAQSKVSSAAINLNNATVPQSESVTDDVRTAAYTGRSTRSNGADEPGAFVKLVRGVVTDPPEGTTNYAALDLANRYGRTLSHLIDQGIGSSAFGPEEADRFLDNSFHLSSFPEDVIHDREDPTFHDYGVVTYLGPVDSSHGITKDSLVQNVLYDRYSYPGKDVSPVRANFTGRSAVYAVDPIRAQFDGALDKVENFDFPIGMIEQQRVPDGVINITSEDHFVYPGTIRRTIVEADGHLFLYTHGVGLNRAQNLGAPTYGRSVFYNSLAKQNDTFGPVAFRTLDREAVRYVNTLRKQ